MDLEAAPLEPLVDDRPDELLPKVRQVMGEEFEIVGILGRGGMANVYLGYERPLARMVALKVLHPLILQAAGMRERFLREARLGAALGHRNVVPIHGLRESGGLIVLVMRAVMGRPLASILTEEGALPIPLVQRILAQVAGALAYSHSRGVIHRDIKPGNILLDEDGTVIVSDFGIAKALEDANLTSTGSRIGTPAYMSPEQCTGGLVTPAADQYGLGAVAYEMLVGRTPFGSDSALGLMYAQTHHTPTPIRELRPDVPLHLAEAVERMLAKEPESRWPTLDEMVRNAGRPVIEGLDDPYADELGRLSRRGSPALQLASTFHPSPTPAAKRSDPDAPTMMLPEPKRSRWPWVIAAAAILTALGSFAYPTLVGRGTPPAFTPNPGRVPPAQKPESTPAGTSAPSTVAAVPPGSTTSRRAATPPAVRAYRDPRRDTLSARIEIGKVMQRFSRAVETRRIADVITAYPPLTPEEQQTWQTLFNKAPALRFDIGIGRITYEQHGAEAELNGFLAYTPTGSPQRKVERWQRNADFALGPEGWRLIRLH